MSHYSWLIHKFPEFKDDRDTEILTFIKMAKSQTTAVRFLVNLVCTILFVVFGVLCSELILNLTAVSIDPAIVYGISIGVSIMMFGGIHRRIDELIVRRKLIDIIESKSYQ